jgi:hypothetical protein
MIATEEKLFEIRMHENLIKFMDGHGKREEKKYETFVFPQDVSIGGLAPGSSQPQYAMSFGFFEGQTS